MTEKISFTRTKTVQEQEKVELDITPGEIVLIRGNRGKQFFIGPLEEVVSGEELVRRGFRDLKVRDSRGTNIDYLEFSEKPYVLTTANVLGVDFPTLTRKMDMIGNRSPFYYSSRNVAELIYGLEAIGNFLKNHEDPQYRQHAEMISRIQRERPEATK